MKISIDIRPIKTKGNGISKYTEKIYKQLKLKDDYSFLDGYYNINNSLKEKLLNKFWEQVILPFKLKQIKSDIFHCTKNMGLPMIKVCKYVVTIHDLIPMIFEDQYLRNPFKKYTYYKTIRQSIYKSDLIITDSKYSKQDIIKNFNVDEKKIKVIYLGVDKKFKSISDADLIRNIKYKYKINGDYILGIGSNEPRKNFQTLLKSYEYIKERYNINEKLVIIGKRWTKDDMNSYKDVIFTGYIDEEDLPIIYSGAKVFVYPSLYEGFGLPPLEAMACGTPVVASNATSIPEVVGQAGILVNPRDEKEIGEAIANVLKNNNLRQELIEKGFKRVKKFNWQKCIKELEEVYKELSLQK
jgi:glycosyltransferase involved in cell wall biosynthesis